MTAGDAEEARHTLPVGPDQLDEMALISAHVAGEGYQERMPALG